MPPRRLERLGDAEIAAGLGVPHRGQQLVLGLELDVADGERADADAGRARDRRAVGEGVDALPARPAARR